MAILLRRRAVPILALTLLLLLAGYTWGLFFTSGNLRFTFVRTWGETGAGPGQFDGPIGVAIGPNDDVYVTDSGNNRIQRFRPDGTFVAAWGEEGSELGQLDEANGTWSRRNTLQGNPLADSGGPLLLLSPGVQFIPLANFLVEATYQMPVWQGLNGSQLGFDPTFKIGLRWLLY